MLHALSVDPVGALFERSMPARPKRLSIRRADAPAETVSRRPNARASLSSISGRLAPLRDARRDRLPADSPSRELSFPLIHLNAQTLGYADSEFSHDLARGMPIAELSPRRRCYLAALGTLLCSSMSGGPAYPPVTQ